MQLVCTEGLVAALASIVTHGDAQSKADAVCLGGGHRGHVQGMGVSSTL